MKNIVFSLIAISFALTGAVAVAQESGDTNKPAVNRHARMVQLTNANAYEIEDAVRKLGFQVNLAATTENTLVLRGTKESLAEVEFLIHEFDIPKTPAQPQRATEYIKLSFDHNVGNLEGALLTAIRSRNSRFAIDGHNGVLILHATPSEIVEAKELVGMMNRQEKPLTLEFSFIRASISSAPGKNTLQGALGKQVTSVLNEAGFGSLELLAPITVTVSNGGDFESQSEFSKTIPDGIEDLAFGVEGAARVMPDTNTVQLEVRANVHGEFTSVANTGQTSFEINTNVSTRLGDYVILTAAPSSTSSGDAIALVLKAVQQNSH